MTGGFPGEPIIASVPKLPEAPVKPHPLFPKIPYTKQKGRLGIGAPDHPPFTRYELARIQKALLTRIEQAVCPRCGARFDRVARRPHGSAGRDAWVVSCGPCGRSAVIPVHRDPEPSGDLFHTLVHSRPVPVGALGWMTRSAGIVGMYVGLLAAFISSERGLVEEAQAAFIPETLLVTLVDDDPQPLVTAVPPPPVESVRRQSLLPRHLALAGADVTTRVMVPAPGPGVTLHDLVDRFPARAVSPPAARAARGPYRLDKVDEPPELLVPGPLRYPAELKNRRVTGYVELEFVVDSTGRAERETIRITYSDHDRFNEAAIAAIEASIYQPGRVRGRPVRVLVSMTVHFEVAEARGRI